MKDFPNTRSLIETHNIVDDVTNVLHVEWNNNRYVVAPELEVNDTIPTGDAFEDISQDAKQIAARFPIDSIVTMNRGRNSAYLIQGTKYKTQPRYVDQRSRRDQDWQDNTTWLWHGRKSRYEYWTSSLRADKAGVLPYNVGRILYTWSRSKPTNKIQIDFQRDNAFPTDWKVYIDTEGNQNWQLVANNAAVPNDGKFVLYRDTVGQPQLPGTWLTAVNRWKPDLDNHVDLYGIKVVINSVDVGHGRPAIIQLSPRLDCNMTELLIDWSTDDELSERDFIAPIGTSSANTGSVTLSNNTGLFNEQDATGLLYKMMDEDVEFRLKLKYSQDTIDMFTMRADSWNTSDFDTTQIQLVDEARLLQNTQCKDMILSNIPAGSALHSMFAGLGLEQFDMVQTRPQETPTMEKFYTRREDKVWDIVMSVCKSFQMSATFDAAGRLKIFSKEAAFNPDASIDYAFTAHSELDKVSDMFSLDRSENSRFNKVVVRYNAVNNFSLSGSRNQKMWTAPDPWAIGAAQVVKNIESGQNFFVIDPNHPEDLPNYSGRIHIEGINNVFDWKGKQYFCKNADPGNKYVKVEKESDYWLAVEYNNGVAPRFTGKVFLKHGKTFNKSFTSKNFGFINSWNVYECRVGDKNGKAVNTGAKHSPVDGSLRVITNYGGGKYLNVTKKAKTWSKFDRVGIKFKVKNNAAKTGLVLWPQGNDGVAGYYFTVDPMSKNEVSAVVKANNQDNNNNGAPPPEIHGYAIRENGNRADMDFDVAKDFKQIPPLRVDRWSYLEVAVYEISGGYEFEVYVDGEYCKTYTDKSIKLHRNQQAGMCFLGNGTTLVDKFYVVNYPADAIDKGKTKKEEGWVVRRKDLWADRKHSNGDTAFNKYLKMVERQKKTQVYEFDFTGRTHSIAREKIVESVRFDFPAIHARMVVTNHAVNKTDFEASSFGARFILTNKSERTQLLKGERQTRVSGATRTFSSYIYGTSFRIADPQEVEYKKDNLIDRIGPLPLEFESDWIQTRGVADDLAQWVMDRFGDNAEIYTMEVFGNPLLEIGDTVSISWQDKGLYDSDKWCVAAISRSWSTGLETTVTVRKIM